MHPRPLSVIPRLVRGHRGVTTIEQTSLVALISVVAVAVLVTVGQRIGDVLNTASNAVN
jgi:Flp pilus assembly pilin Flp